MLTTGTDLIEIARIERAYTRFGDQFLERVFTPLELMYCRGRLSELAARFAAKEATSKALGVGMRMMSPFGIHWQDVEITADHRGKPILRLHGRAAERAAELDLSEWSVSLTHTKEHALAFVVAL